MSIVKGIVLVTACAGSANGQLVDPGFDINPLVNYVTVLNNFVAQQGVWGDENSTIVGVTGSVTPISAPSMLRMDNDGLTVTQAWQVTDMSPWAAQISAGTATFNLSGNFNVENLAAAQAYIRVNFYTAPNLGSYTGSATSGVQTLDVSPLTWQTLGTNGTIPIGTTWITTEVGYVNASIGNLPGFVDDARLTIAPTPGSAALLGIGGLLAARRRR